MARKVYKYYEKYPQFGDSVGVFDPKTFDIREIEKDDISDILARRKDYTIYFDDFERLMYNPTKNIGVIFKLIHKYSRDGAFLYDLITTKPGSQPKVLDTVREEIQAEIEDEVDVRETFKDFMWILKNMKLAMIAYVQEAIKGSFNGASPGTKTPIQTRQTEQTDQGYKPSKCGGALVDPPGCG